MKEVLNIGLAFMAGSIMGILFFGGLLFTVKKSVASKIPALWILLSFLFRASTTLVGFYYISLGSWQGLLICTIGFIMARFLVVHFTKQKDKKILN